MFKLIVTLFLKHEFVFCDGDIISQHIVYLILLK